jgi:hypothetical protein
MPRIRSIKPEVLQHRKVGRLSDRSLRLWLGMLTQADDEGRLIADLEQFRVLFFGYQLRTTTTHIEAALHEILTSGLIQLYRINGTTYVAFHSWRDHQRLDKPTPSNLPAYDPSCDVQVIVSDQSGNDTGMFALDRIGGIGEDRRGSTPLPPTGGLVRQEDFDRFWTAYPNKVGKGYAHTCFLRAMKQTTIEEILGAIENQRGCDRWQRGYIPNPSTWLNQQRWKDQPPKPKNRLATKRTEGNLAAVQAFVGEGANAAD